MAGESSTGKPNRLIHEKSPYLLQHAYNPVDWYPWGAEGFAKARRENKPIFLSIGYSTCHWCHVMEHESFENNDVAALMNRYFVSIKVDREERPDIDKIYMTAVQATTGSGGWPMSVFLTPDLKPFYCGTYFPPEPRYGRPGFKELLQRVHDVWETNHDDVVTQAEQITDTLKKHSTLRKTGGELNAAPLKLGFEQLQFSFDSENGGFGGAPKFPRPVALNFLFRYSARAQTRTQLPPDSAKARDMALLTLRKMGEGGLFDQLGGGFHRYSVDERWLVSHFEKMLYDQAQLASSYVDAWQITHDPFFANTARRTCDYVLRDMTSPDGGFYSAEDADSEGVEGKFYVWTRKEVEDILGKSEASEIFCRYYGIESAGNWEHGNNVLHVALSVEQTAKLFHKPESEVQSMLDAARERLFAARQKRVRPHRDEKIITAWNGLMISALARAAQVDVGHLTSGGGEAGAASGEATDNQYVAAAERAAQFILSQRIKDGRLMRTETVPAMVEDYALFANGLIELYETDFDPQWLLKAVELSDKMLAFFYDSKDDGFFQTDGRDESILLRSKEDYDGAEPSGNSMATLLLLRLAQFTNQPRYREPAEKTLRLFGRHMREAPQAVPQMLSALDFYLSEPKQIVIAGNLKARDTRAMLDAARQIFLPNKIILVADDWRTNVVSYIKDMKMLHGKATAYVCVNYACQLPTTNPSDVLKQLSKE